MASEPEISPKTKHRFGFAGKRKRTSSQPQTVEERISSDDVLDSLTRQASSQVGRAEAQTKTLEILDDPEAMLQEEPTVSTVDELVRKPGGRFGRFAFVLMGLGGLIAVWFYSSGRSLFNSSLLNNLIQRTIVRSVFGNPVEVGVVSMISLLIASWVAVRRKRFTRILDASVN